MLTRADDIRFRVGSDDAGILQLMLTASGRLAHGLLHGVRIRRADPPHEGGSADDAAVLTAHKELVGIVGIDVALVLAVGQLPDGSVRSNHAGLVDQLLVLDSFVVHPDVGAGHLDGAGQVHAQYLADAPGGQLDKPVARLGLLVIPGLGWAHPAAVHQVGPGLAGGPDNLGGHGRLHLA